MEKELAAGLGEGQVAELVSMGDRSCRIEHFWGYPQTEGSVVRRKQMGPDCAGDGGASFGVRRECRSPASTWLRAPDDRDPP